MTLATKREIGSDQQNIKMWRNRSLVELVGRIPENGGSKPTAILVGWWVFVFPPKYTGDLLVQVGIPEGFWPKSRGLRGLKMVGKCWVLVE